MSLYSISIRRPVLAVVMATVIVLFGLIGFSRLGVREFPSVDPPVITVSTEYRGANTDVIESQITEPLEDSINGIAGIRTLTSVSREGRSTITVEFELGSDLERAANDVRDRVSRAQYNLPPDVEPPRVAKADADAFPILMLTVYSDTRNLLELSRLADEVFAERLQTIEGVSDIMIWGDRTYAMRLWIDPQKLAAYQLSPMDVRDAVRDENVELPSGRIEGREVELAVRTLGRLNTPEAFENLILKEQDGRVVRFRDVGRAELGPRNDRSILKADGIPMVAVVLRPLPGANYVAIADEYYRRVEQIRRDLPEDIRLNFGFDASEYIRKSVAEVEQTIAVAFLLVILVIFLFLREWRTTFIPVVVIPVALIGAFFVMDVAGFTLNVLTLLGIVLAIGLVVDDAIIVLENIYSKIEAGMAPVAAGIEGTREIFFAVIATTVALVSVLLPILFMGGLTGQLFVEFGITLAGAVVISSFIALTLTPMLSTRVLQGRRGHSRFYEATAPFFAGLADGYRRSLEALLRHRWVAFPIILVSAGLIALFLQVLPAELAPLEDREGIGLNARGPEGATFEYMDAFVDEMIALIEDEASDEVRLLVTVTSPGFGASSSTNSAFARIYLTEPEQRSRSQHEIANAIRRRSGELTGARVLVSETPTISVGHRHGLPVQFVLQAPNLEKLQEALPTFVAEAERDPAFSAVDVDLVFDKPELRVNIDRDRARDLGISALDIAETIQLALSEQRLGFFVMDGKQYEVIGQVERADRDETLDLTNLYVPSRSGTPVLLDKIVAVSEESRPPQLYRYDRYLSATVSADLNPGYTVADGIVAMEEIADRVLDTTFSTALTGQSRDFAESSRSLIFVFLLALALVYLTLAAQFESFRDPFTIMLSVPLALAGALFSLWYFQLTLNVFSEIGMIMLIGLVTKNGILIVEFANQRKEQGLNVLEATVEGATARFRPVLMTTLSTVLGILPIALALGAGSESRVPMGVAIIGGLLLGTGLTLYVVPAVYSYLTHELSAQERALHAAEDVAASPTP
ncbi:MAG: efflux RND transporter permease subunit [Acidobacteria bacterium]|nr:efflux RND transporter permease subunit [Acidobacteriota bacterium]